MRLKHLHGWLGVVGIVRRPDGSLSDGCYLCSECGTVLDFRAGRWIKRTEAV